MKILVFSIVLSLAQLRFPAYGLDDSPEGILAAWEKLPGVYSVERSRRIRGYWEIRLQFDSPSNRRQIYTEIHVPGQYFDQPFAQYPVLYTLQIFSGLFGAGQQLLDNNPTILVAWSSRHPSPNAKDREWDSGWWINSTTRPQCQLETFFFDELHPFIADHFSILDRVAITGFSSGAYAAHLYMLRKPDLFSSVSGIHARYFAAGYGGTMSSHITRWYGGYNEQTKHLHDAHSLPLLLKAHVENGKKLPPMFTIIGSRDYLLEDNRRWARTVTNENRRIIANLIRAFGQREGYDKQSADLSGSVNFERSFMNSDYFKKRYPALSVDFEYLEMDGTHGASGTSFVRALQFHQRHFDRPVAPVRIQVEGDALLDAEIQVRLETGISEAVLHYSLDGSEPTAESPVYRQPFSQGRGTALKVRAFVDGRPASRIYQGPERPAVLSIDWPASLQVIGPLPKDAPALSRETLSSIPDAVEVDGAVYRAGSVTTVNGFVDFTALYGGYGLEPMPEGQLPTQVPRPGATSDQADAGRQAYAFATIDVPEDGHILIGAGADWWMRWYLDGALVYDTFDSGNRTTAYGIGNHAFIVPVTKGRRVLAVHVRSGSAGWCLVSGSPAD